MSHGYVSKLYDGMPPVRVTDSARNLCMRCFYVSVVCRVSVMLFMNLQVGHFVILPSKGDSDYIQISLPIRLPTCNEILCQFSTFSTHVNYGKS